MTDSAEHYKLFITQAVAHSGAWQCRHRKAAMAAAACCSTLSLLCSMPCAPLSTLGMLGCMPCATLGKLGTLGALAAAGDRADSGMLSWLLASLKDTPLEAACVPLLAGRLAAPAEHQRPCPSCSMRPLISLPLQ